MFTATQRIRVEWAHCDPAGIIFNPHYYVWMDQGTHSLLCAAGFDFFQAVRDPGPFLGCPLVASNLNFKHPLRFGDVTELRSRPEKFGHTSFTIGHRFTLNGRLVAEGSEVRVWVDRDPNRPQKLLARPVPDRIKSLLEVERTVDVTV